MHTHTSMLSRMSMSNNLRMYETLSHLSCIRRHVVWNVSIIICVYLFQLADLLIKPIQRIQKYHLLMKKILSYTEQANCPPHIVASLRDAMYCTDIIPKNANNMMDVGRLQGFTVRPPFYYTYTLFFVLMKLLESPLKCGTTLRIYAWIYLWILTLSSSRTHSQRITTLHHHWFIQSLNYV